MHSPEATLDQVRRDISAWRRHHKRGPLPLELRERAGVVAGFLGEDVVAETLDIAVSVVGGWAERHGGVRPQRVDVVVDERPAFVDVGRQLATALGGGAAQHAGAWLVEISKPCGTTIRLQGPLDAAQLEAVVRGASVAL